MKYYAGPFESVSLPGIGTVYQPPAGTISLVDLRNIPQQSVANNSNGFGSGFFVTPDDVTLPSEWTLLGQGRIGEIQANGAIKSAWETLFGVIPQGSFLVDYLADTLTEKSDPTGDSAPKPIVPSIGPPIGQATINLAGHSIVHRRAVNIQTGNSKYAKSLRAMVQKNLENIADNDLNPDQWRLVLAKEKQKYGQTWDDSSEDHFLTARLKNKGKGRNGKTFADRPKTTYTESFPSDTAINSGSQDRSWTVLLGSTPTVISGVLRPNHAVASDYWRMGSALSSSDQYTKHTMPTKHAYSGANYPASGNICRKDSADATLTFYFTFHTDQAGTFNNYTFKKIAGTNTVLQNANEAPSAGDYFTLECNGSSIIRKRNTSTQNTTTDTAIASNTYCGVVIAGDNAGVNAYVDPWECSDLSGGGPVIPVFMNQYRQRWN